VLCNVSVEKSSYLNHLFLEIYGLGYRILVAGKAHCYTKNLHGEMWSVAYAPLGATMHKLSHFPMTSFFKMPKLSFSLYE